MITEQTLTIEATRHLIESAFFGDLGAAKQSLTQGADINAVDPDTGLSPLHIAIGRNHLELVNMLLDKGAVVGPDRQGRWPSTIAELCEASEEICDRIVDAEAAIGDV
jgi:ankyrin repeat protein